MAEVISQLEKCGLAPPSGQGVPKPAIVRPVSPSAGKAETVDLPQTTIRSAAPPPPTTPMIPPITARARQPGPPVRRPSKGGRKQRTIQDEMQRAISAADRQRRRRLGLGLWGVFNLLNKGSRLILSLLLAAAAVAGTYYAATTVWTSTRVIGKGGAIVVEAVNPKLKSAGFETVESVNFTNASRFRSLPERLKFQAPLLGNTPAGRRPLGEMTGELDPAKGELVFDLDRHNGADERGIRFQVEPVQ